MRIDTHGAHLPPLGGRFLSGRHHASTLETETEEGSKGSKGSLLSPFFADMFGVADDVGCSREGRSKFADTPRASGPPPVSKAGDGGQEDAHPWSQARAAEVEASRGREAEQLTDLEGSAGPNNSRSAKLKSRKSRQKEKEARRQRAMQWGQEQAQARAAEAAQRLVEARERAEEEEKRRLVVAREREEAEEWRRRGEVGLVGPDSCRRALGLPCPDQI